MPSEPFQYLRMLSSHLYVPFHTLQSPAIAPSKQNHQSNQTHIVKTLIISLSTHFETFRNAFIFFVDLRPVRQSDWNEDKREPSNDNQQIEAG